MNWQDILTIKIKMIIYAIDDRNNSLIHKLNKKKTIKSLIV